MGTCCAIHSRPHNVEIEVKHLLWRRGLLECNPELITTIRRMCKTNPNVFQLSGIKIHNDRLIIFSHDHQTHILSWHLTLTDPVPFILNRASELLSHFNLLTQNAQQLNILRNLLYNSLDDTSHEYKVTIEEDVLTVYVDGLWRCGVGLMVVQPEPNPNLAPNPEPEPNPEPQFEIKRSDTPNSEKLADCVICLVQKSSHIMLPCGHVCVCDVCAGLMKQFRERKCPKCRTVLTHVKKAFF
jgi:hypothetical protein